MTDLKFEIDSEQFERLASTGMRAVSLALKYTATEVWGGIRRDAPVDHGRLAGSFQLFQDSELAYRISSEVHYALHVHEGTGEYGPHNQRIYPTNARALSFFWKRLGRQVFFASVAGVQGRPYTKGGIESATNRTDEFIRRAIKETMEAVS